MNLPTFSDRTMFVWMIGLLPLGMAAAWLVARRRAGWRKLGRSDRPPRGGEVATCVVVALLLFALARPLGMVLMAAAQVQGRDLVLVVDVSRSMGAEDAFPSRLGLALETVRGVLGAFGANANDRAGLVAFAGRGVVRSPLTENLGAVDEALRRLRPGGVQPGGTDIGAAIDAALQLFDDAEPSEGRSILLVSDGEDHPAVWKEAVARCKALRVIVHTLAVGDADIGAVVPESTINTRRQDATLERMAKETGGAFVALGTSTVDARALYRQVIEPGARRMRTVMGWTERVELYGWLVAPAFFLLTLRGAVSTLGYGRRVVGWCLVVCMIASSGGADRPINDGVALFQAGRFDEAQAYYKQQRRSYPDRPVLAFNEGEALFALGRFEEAVAAYRAALSKAERPLRIKTEYALANALTASHKLQAAIAAYDRCLALAAPDAPSIALQHDARINREFARALLQSSDAGEGGQGRRDTEGQRRPSYTSTTESNRSPRAGRDTSSNQRTGGQNRQAPTQSTPNSSAPESDDNRSPEERLASSLRNIDAAKAGRLEPPPRPPVAASGHLPDW